MNEVFITGEIGINHNGNINIAKKLIDMAKYCGCNAVKFQKRNIDVVYSKEFLDSHRDSPWGTTQRQQKEGLEFNKKEYDIIDAYCKRIGIDWYASAWDVESQHFLNQYNLKYNKVASAMTVNKDFLHEVAKERKKTFISTGMSTKADIDELVDLFDFYKCPYVLMHCVSLYPCPIEKLNLKAIKTIKDRYACEVGYSGHEVGVWPSVIAVAYGANCIERHITLNRAMYGSDQSASLEKYGLEKTVKYCRAVPSVLGDGSIDMIPEEEPIAKKLRYWI